MGFICAKWIRLDDGCVARCDKDHTHQGRHLDSIIDICWPDNDPRMKANMPATTAAELVKRVQTRQFELARAIEQRNHAIAMESPYEAGQLIQTSDGTRYRLTAVQGTVRACHLTLGCQTLSVIVFQSKMANLIPSTTRKGMSLQSFPNLWKMKRPQ